MVWHIKAGVPLFVGSCFEIEYPSLWEAEIIEDIPAFFDPDGAGALQIASILPGAGEIDLSVEMEKYLARHGISYQSDRVTFYKASSGHAVAACEFIVDERFWLVTLLCDGRHLLIATYNADEVPAPDDAAIISSAINSIRFP
jgi:hypothetical protein